MVRVRPVSAAPRPTVTAAAWALALALTLVAVALPAPAAACRCRRPKLLGSYFGARITSVVIATPQRVVSDDGGRRTYGLLGGPYPTNTTVYKGCPQKLERFSVYGPGNSCQTTFALGVPVLLFIRDDRFVGPCDYTVPASELTAGDVAFLARRAGCANATPRPGYGGGGRYPTT
ncbi:hypothetical protein BU14_0121s0007 [Porphyra umbilicalis]|uniref:Uncharacterized protein n=1 Tax=Porphyra umbilicalis TaxID=2786 RepID=A0A1X6PAZ6_PORUM|nr:hypothetical protein BU14_0121s0007 [Porphyra umbilicalis]|eukprot:OSX78079.1 hypothetical protein BU14_0121s0007 [Porphyra umbilicalis]